jgi:hypothetical protein
MAIVCSAWICVTICCVRCRQIVGRVGGETRIAFSWPCKVSMDHDIASMMWCAMSAEWTNMEGFSSIRWLGIEVYNDTDGENTCGCHSPRWRRHGVMSASPSLSLELLAPGESLVLETDRWWWHPWQCSCTRSISLEACLRGYVLHFSSDCQCSLVIFMGAILGASVWRHVLEVMCCISLVIVNVLCWSSWAQCTLSLVIPRWWLSQSLLSPATHSSTPLGFRIIIAKTRGACVIATFWPNEEMGRNQDGLGEYIRNVLLDRPCAWIWAKLPVYLYIITFRFK